MLRKLKQKYGVALRQAGWREASVLKPEHHTGPPPDNGTVHDQPFHFVANNMWCAAPGEWIIQGSRTICRDVMGVHDSVQMRPTPLLNFWRQAYASSTDRLNEAVHVGHCYNGQYNHYHFLTDVAPRVIHAARQFTDPNVKLVIGQCMRHSKPLGRVIEALELPIDRFHFVQPGRPVHVGTLHVINRPTFEAPLHQMLKRLLAKPMDSRPNRKLFLMRASNTRRPLVNQQEIAMRLAQFDFETVDMGALTLDKQIQSIRQACMVVAEHGAALSNLYFAEPAQLRLLELMPPGYKSDCFMHLCRNMELRFDRLRGVAQPSGAEHGYHVDPRDIEAWVRAQDADKATS